MRRTGFSLAETVLAIFIMVGAMIVFGMLMHSMLNYGTRAQQRAMAALAAQKKLEEIREWANTGANFFAAWPYVNQTATDPAFPGVTLLSQTGAQTLISPCTELESKNASPRTIAQSCIKVRVTASWPQDNGQPIRLVTLMCPPNRVPNPKLNLSGAVPGSLPPGASYSVGVSAVDSTGQPLRDLMFQWSSLPTGNNPGNGTAVPLNGNGSTAQFTNGFQPQTGGPVITVGGTCCMGVIAFYRGQILQGATSAVTLQP